MGNTPDQNETSGATVDASAHDPLHGGFPAGSAGRFLFYVGIAFSVFQVATAAHLVDFPSQIIRAVHVGFLGLMGFPLLALVKY